MAKAFGPIQIVGTLDDLNFYITPDGNIVRTKGKSGNTKKSFKKNPIFETIKKHNLEFALCAKKAAVFRRVVQPFYTQAKDGSIAGRSIQLLFAIVKEDLLHPRGTRQVTNGLQSQDALDFLIGFEGNKARPLGTVLKKKVHFNWIKKEVNFKTIDALRHLDWPANAAQVHLQLAISNWNCENDTFETHYSNEIILQKEAGLQKMLFDIAPLENHDLWLAFLHIKFSSRVYNTVKVLPSRFNTTSLISVCSLCESTE